MVKTRWRTLEAAAVMLFTFQAIRVLFAVLFARVYDALFDGHGAGALLFAAALAVAMLLLPLASPRDPRRISASLRVSAVLCALSRVPLSINVPAIRIIAAAATMGFSGLYVAGLLRSRARTLTTSISLAVFLDQLLRALGNTYDLSLRPWWGIVQLLISLGIIILGERMGRGDSRAEATTHDMDGVGLWSGVSYGAALFLISSLVALPNAAARWTGIGYAPTVVWMMAAATLPLWPPIQRVIGGGTFARAQWPRVVAGFLALSGLVLADKGHSILALLGLWQGIVAFWLLLPHSLHSGSNKTEAGVVVGMLLFLLLGIAHAFSFTYAYTIPQFKGAGLPTFILAAVLAVGPAIAPRRVALPAVPPAALPKPRLWLASAIACLLLAGGAAMPRPIRPQATIDVARLATYNIHYGYDTHWRLSLEEQAQTIEARDVDIVALQEVDTGRLTSFGIDNALWLARRLKMKAVYLPTVEHTTGIALLSRLDIIESEGMLLPSEGEPTGIVRALVRVGGASVRAHGIWLGLTPQDRARQLRGALAFIGDGVATLAGDMNATPDSPVGEMMRAHGFIDPFVEGGFEELPTAPAEAPSHRIDHVWLRRLKPWDARVSDSLASDHRMVVVEAR